MEPLDTSDQALIQAIRRRLLQEIEARGGDAQHIVNNVYGGSLPSQSGGMMDQMGGAGGPTVPDGEDPYEYFVDIVRRDLEEKDPDTGKPVGWEKSVRRFRKHSGIEPLDEKKKLW